MKKLVVIFGLMTTVVGVSAQKERNHNFEISKNLEIFNDIYKQLDLFYVDTLSADTVIEWGINSIYFDSSPGQICPPGLIKKKNNR